MKNRKRKFVVFTLLLACLMLFGTIYVSAEDEEVETSGDCGENATWNFEASTGVLTISGAGEMDDYKKISAVPWFAHRHDVKEIVIRSGITKIGSLAFDNCAATSVSIPESVTHINSCAFQHCAKLMEIKLPSKLVLIGNSAFAYCQKLKVMELPESVICFGTGILQHCDSLEKFTVPSNLKHIPARMFSGSGLRWITIPATVESIGDEAFGFCYYLEAVQFRGDAPTLQNSVFFQTKTTVTYPVSNPTWGSTVRQNYGGTVTWESDSGNGQYGTYRMLNWKMEGNTLYITRDPQIGDVPFPTIIGWHAYRDTIEKVVMSGEIDSITARFFEGCKNLKQIQFSDGIEMISENAFKDCISLESLVIPDSVTQINSNVFFGCHGLKNVELPKNLEYIGWNAFKNCSGLQSVTIPSGVKRMHSCVFEGCTSLKTIKFTGAKPELVDYSYTPGGEVRPGVFQLPYTEPGTFGLIGSAVTVYYPESADGWTEQNVQKLAGQYPKDKVTFVSYKSQEQEQTPAETTGTLDKEQPDQTKQDTPQTNLESTGSEDIPATDESQTSSKTENPGATNSEPQQTLGDDSNAGDPAKKKSGAKWWIPVVIVVVVAAGATGAVLFIKKKKF